MKAPNVCFIGIIIMSIISAKYFDKMKTSPETVLRSKIENIDAFIRTTLACRTNISALSIAVVHNGKIVMTRGYGHIDDKKKRKADENTVFGIGSLTKGFTATLLLKTLHQKRIPVTTKISKILGPRFRFSDYLLTHYATLSDALSHRLGISDCNFVRFQYNFTRQHLPGLISKLRRAGRFRDSFNYSNIVYGLLAHVTELLAEDQSWESLMKQEMFAPLGMTNTFIRGYESHETKQATFAPPLVRTQNGFETAPTSLIKQMGKLGGSGSIMTSARDAARWLFANLHEGRTPEGDQAIPVGVVRRAHVARAQISTDKQMLYFTKPTTPVTFVLNGYGYGWASGYYRGYSTVTHSGLTVGYTSLVTLIPKARLGIYISNNSPDTNKYVRLLLSAYIADVMLGNNAWLNHTTACSFPEPWARRVHQADVELSDTAYRNLPDYTGVFYNTEFGELSITLNSTSNLLELNYGIASFHLLPEKTPDYFYCTGIRATQYMRRRHTVFQMKTQPISVKVTCLNVKHPPIFHLKSAL